MPPFYPDQHGNQYNNNNNDPYYNQYNGYNQYQYSANNPNQTIPPYSQIQVNVPSPSGNPNHPQALYQQHVQYSPHQTQHQPQHQPHLQSPVNQVYQQQNSMYMRQNQHSPYQGNFQPQQPQYPQHYQHDVQSQILLQSPQQVPQQVPQQAPQQVSQQVSQQAQQQQQQQTRPPPHQLQQIQQQQQQQSQIQQQRMQQQPQQSQHQHQHQHQHQNQQQPQQQQQLRSPFLAQDTLQAVKPVQVQPVQRAPLTQHSRVLQDVKSNTSRPQQAPSKPSHNSESEQQELDYGILLLTLADEYLEAAAKMTVRSEDYFKMTATALGCLESVLTNFKLPPLREAQVSLRYAQLLYNETDNNDDAETMLTKTIELCERMKFIDLKYAAQLLLAQVLHRSNSKAAIKELQSIILDIETYKHSAWEYAFRLQLVSFHMTSALPNDIHAAGTQLERLCHTAKQNGDNTIYAFSAILETLVNMQSSNSDATQAAQRALAKARAMQLNADVSGNPQMMIMMEFLDLCIHIKESDFAQGEPKRKMMQSVLYSSLENPNWRSDGMMFIPINRGSLRGLQVQESGVIAERNGKYYLALYWLPKEEVEDLGYLFSGVSAAFKNAGDNGKAEKFFEEGLEMIRELGKEKRSLTCRGDEVNDRRLIVETHFLLERVFLQCSKGQWTRAETTLNIINEIISQMVHTYPAEMQFLIDYVKGSVAQGKGNIDEGLNIFASQIRRLHPPASNSISTSTSGSGSNSSSSITKGPLAQKRAEVYRNTSILAAMNTIFMIQQKSHPHHHRLQQLVNMLDPLVHNSTNKTIQAAWNFILAILPNNTILKTKQYLSYALNAAQAINSAQITTLCLTAMHDKFFQGVVGDQALKCARAATHQAKKLNEPMWIGVTTALESSCLDVHGMTEEAIKKRDESDRVLNILPERVRNG